MRRPRATPWPPGNLLLGELNCTSCHQADASLATVIQRKPAPVLDTVGSRVKPQYLLKFLADPQATKPGTTMPNVLAGVPEAERGADRRGARPFSGHDRHRDARQSDAASRQIAARRCFTRSAASPATIRAANRLPHRWPRRFPSARRRASTRCPA